jgi:hypothetical protein
MKRTPRSLVLQGLILALLSTPTANAFAEGNYQISKTDAVVTVGSKGKASVTISARKGWHLNAEAPLTLKLGTAPGIETEKAKLGRSDLAMSTEAQARFDVGVTASEPGKKALDAEASFVLCQEESCQPVKTKVTIAVDASADKKLESTPAHKKTKTK